jgi:hypothetical protein
VKVFISWSGEPSRSVAKALRDWLPTVVQHVEPWMPNEEIISGTRWNKQIGSALGQTDFGIVCVTASNQHEPWLMFEAGALVKQLGDTGGRVVPLCVDLRPAEMTGPLAAFQALRLDKAGMRRLVYDIMRLRKDPPPEAQIDQLFQAMWPVLESKVQAAERQAPGPRPAHRSYDDMLAELVDRVRRLERDQSRPVQGFVYSGFGARATDEARASDEEEEFLENPPPG